MSEFKVGDRVLVKSKSTDYSYFSSFKTGLIGKVLSFSNLSEVNVRFDENFGGHDCSGECENGHGQTVKTSDLELISSTEQKNMTNIIAKYKELFLNEPEKTFRKAGIADANGNLTSDGSIIFQAFLLEKYGNDFKTEVVDKILAEEDKK